MTLEDILKEVQTIAGMEYTIYSPLDRQRVIQLRIEFAKERAKLKAEKKSLTRQLKKYHAEKLAIIRSKKDEETGKTPSLDDAKWVIQLDEWYIALELKNDANEYLDDICDIIKETFSELVTLIRDAMKDVEEQTI